MNRACTHRLEIFNSGGITGNTTGAFVPVPAGVGDFYIKATFTEDSAGGITATLMGNESASTTNAFTLDDLGGATSATGVDRAFRAAMSATNQEVLPVWLYIDCASVTGEWTLVVELYYGILGR